MPKHSTKAEKALLQTVMCPECEELLSLNATRCPRCGLRLARGSLGLRVPHHAKTMFVRRGWVRRFLRVD